MPVSTFQGGGSLQSQLLCLELNFNFLPCYEEYIEKKQTGTPGVRAHLLILLNPKVPEAILQPSACTSNCVSFSFVFHTTSHSLVPSSSIPLHFDNIKMYFSFKIQFRFVPFHACVQPLKALPGLWQHSQLL